MKKILVVGDSFAFGQGCSDRLFYYDVDKKCKVGDYSLMFQGPSKFCFGSLMQNDYPNYKVVNQSLPGMDNISIMNTMLKHMDDDVELVLFSGTGHNRLQIASPRHKEVPMSWVIGTSLPEDFPKSFVDAADSYIKHLYNDMALTNITVAAIMGSYGLAKAFNKKIIWSSSDLSFARKLEGALDVIGEHRVESIINTLFEGPAGKREPILEYHSIDHHANDLGHKNYYENYLLPKLKEIGL